MSFAKRRKLAIRTLMIARSVAYRKEWEERQRPVGAIPGPSIPADPVETVPEIPLEIKPEPKAKNAIELCPHCGKKSIHSYALKTNPNASYKRHVYTCKRKTGKRKLRAE